MLGDRLRGAGFAPDENEAGNPTRQRWKVESGGGVTLEFLIPPSLPGDTGGTLRNIESDLAAVISPGLELAFRDRERITLSGWTINEEYATRDVWVCGPGAFIVLKALAFKSRGENKDAYDLYYIARNFGSGTQDVVARLKLFAGDPFAESALEILRQDFLDYAGLGPRRVAEFIALGHDATIQADVAGFLRELVKGLVS